MRYTENGLQINLEELRRMLEYAENRAQYGNMERCIYIKGGENRKLHSIAAMLNASRLTTR